jgi:hypothetical protein
VKRGRGLGAGLALASALPLAAQPPDRSAEIFGRYAGRVVKIEVVETGSGAKASLGTGFFVTAEGHLLTNYHVVAEVVHQPARYRPQWLDQSGAARAASVSAIDVVADLAVLATDAQPDAFLTLGAPAVPRGTRLYSLGHPQDLGLSIVEGTYNGLLEHALYPKIHFTGPLNPGMSGGPALTGAGEVVGINVSTGGNSVSFLVPVDRGRALLERAREQPAMEEEELLDQAGAQVLEHQQRYLATLFRDGRAAPVRLGPYELPTEPADFFRCWGDAERDDEALYERVIHRCSTDDFVYLTVGQSSGVLTMQHELLTSRGLNPARFYALYTRSFRAEDVDLEPEEGGDRTEARCRTGNVRHDRMVLRTIFCLRGYLDFPGLYDATLRAAVLGARDVGLIITLTLSGVSFPNAERIARELLARVRRVQ